LPLAGLAGGFQTQLLRRQRGGQQSRRARFPSRSENTMSGNNTSTPSNFVVALLAEDRSEFLVFNEGNENWLEYGDYTYHQCNW